MYNVIYNNKALGYSNWFIYIFFYTCISNNYYYLLQQIS